MAKIPAQAYLDVLRLVETAGCTLICVRTGNMLAPLCNLEWGKDSRDMPSNTQCVAKRAIHLMHFSSQALKMSCCFVKGCSHAR